GAAVVSSESINRRAIFATSSMARLNAFSLTCDGALKPLSFRTNCSEAARISSSVAGGSRFNNDLMLRHMVFCVPGVASMQSSARPCSVELSASPARSDRDSSDDADPPHGAAGVAYEFDRLPFVAALGDHRAVGAIERDRHRRLRLAAVRPHLHDEMPAVDADHRRVR